MIAFVVAYSENRVIGNNNQMPWHLPNDLKHFKKITYGHTVVMGRKTFQSIGKPLPGRNNIILTTNPQFLPEGVKVVHSKKEIITLSEDLYIIGGAEIFSLFFDVVDHLYITRIHTHMSGDTFFPEWDQNDFQLLWEKTGMLDDQNQLPHTFYHFKRKLN